MKDHQGTESGATDATNNNHQITTSMKEASTNHNGGIFYAVAHPPGTDTKIEIETKPKRYQRKFDIGTEMDNE